MAFCCFLCLILFCCCLQNPVKTPCLWFFTIDSPVQSPRLLHNWPGGSGIHWFIQKTPCIRDCTELLRPNIWQNFGSSLMCLLRLGGAADFSAGFCSWFQVVLHSKIRCRWFQNIHIPNRYDIYLYPGLGVETYPGKSPARFLRKTYWGIQRPMKGNVVIHAATAEGWQEVGVPQWCPPGRWMRSQLFKAGRNRINRKDNPALKQDLDTFQKGASIMTA